MAERLSRLGLSSVEDLLFHLPHRYEDRTRLFAINQLLPGMHATVVGTVEHCELQHGKRRMLICRISDGLSVLTLRFFNFSAAQKNALAVGTQLRCYGEVRRGQRGPEMIHPEYRPVNGSQIAMEESLTPVYPTTDGLKQLTLRNLTEQALDYLHQGVLDELLPPALFPDSPALAQALFYLHRPPPSASLEQLEQGQHPAQQRLIFEELLAHNLSMLQLKQQSNRHAALPIVIDPEIQQRFLSSLPFQPTGAQQRVVNEIYEDLTRSQPMMRLVQGDVGSGKTLVAALTALSSLSQGHQVALMAPTELLAEQHYKTFQEWLAPLGIVTTWLAGKLKGKVREQALEAISTGQAQMIIGTHAIFQQQVSFNHLGLIIIDEQHRFGVHQRLELREKGQHQGRYPHQLIMTATPIPRTLAMTAYADLDTSIIDELPPGRTPVTTVAISDLRRQEVIERVKLACQQGRQSYWVCTLIDESEVLECQAAENTAQELSVLLPELRIGLIHGRMKSADKQQIMSQFSQGELHLLVATTVIEVGVDVPNASLMIIENPERLGLAQLHQLRGRVGRGGIASHCVLLYHSPLSPTASKRLGVLRDTNDGFVIAQRDLEIRGPGEVLGTKQTGLAELKVADLVRDQQLIPEVQRLAQQICDHYPQAVEPIVMRWLGARHQYIQA